MDLPNPSRFAAVLLLLAAGGCSSPTLTHTPAETSSSITNVQRAMPYQPTGGPLDALQPKKETGVDRFLSKYPEADGRGVVVAIFDTGVDPGAPGLQVTTDGKPKIIDVVDGTGSGDVDTSTVVELSEDGTFEGLSGRTLTPSPDWNNPSGEYRVGLKPASELYPRGLDSRMARERRKDWDQAQRVLTEKLHRELAAFDKQHPSPDEEQFKVREDLVARIDQLKSLQDSFDDPGPIYDCVVYNDGSTWRAAIDTDGDGEFGDEKTLTNFRDEREFGTFGEVDLLNYALNIYNDGDVLSIVADAGAHGTHVAGIVAANFPDQPELNGMAPGAQIVAVKIGDTRLGSSSVGTGTTRGYTAVLENNVDVINMSYGGADAFPDTRYRNGQLVSEIVNKHGVIFVSSAGNDGPAFSTVGGPGGSTTALIGVGAAISPEMMKAQYALRNTETGPLQYPWSSRGPTLDGDLGVDVTAPGGAIAPVPNWTLQKNQLMNGTSMSSPNTAGGISLILSKLKQDDAEYTPHSVRRALMNTAVLMPGQSRWAQGSGMIQVDSAYEHLVNYEEGDDRDVFYTMRGPDGERGLYLREPYENNQPVEQRISISVNFHEDAPSRKKVDFEKRLTLSASEPWVEVTDFANLAAGGETTDIRVDPTGLPEGAHFAEILASDADHPERGPIARYPITVIKGKPMNADNDYTWRDRVESKPGALNKWFFEVPEGATWMDVIIRRLDKDTSRLLVVQALELLDDRANNTHKFSNWVRFDDSDEERYSLRLDGGRTVELAAAQNWSSLGTGEFEFEVRFRGLRPEPSQLFIEGAMLENRFDIRSPLRDMVASPSGSLTHLRRSFNPKDWTVRALDPVRDRLSDDRQMHEIIVEYEISVPKDLGANINPSISLAPHAWEVYESFLWTITGKDGELVEVNAGEDVDVDLDEGDYTLRLHVRHDDPGELDRLKEAPVIVGFELPSAVRLSFASTPDAALAGRGNFGSPEIEAGGSVPCYVATPKTKSLPDFVKPGDLLTGSFTLGGDTELSGSSSRPGGWPVAMTVIDKPSDKPEVEAAKSDDDEEEPAALDKLREDIRDLKVKRLADLMTEEDAEAFDAIANEVLAEEPNHLPVLVKQMERSVKLERDADFILAAAHAVLEQIDEDKVAAYFGKNHDKDSDSYDEDLAEEMKEQKEAVIAAYAQIAETLGDEATAEDSDSIEVFEDAIDDLAVWTSVESDDYFDLRLKREMLHERFGKALSMLSDKLGDEPEKDLYEQRIELLETLGWDEWANHERAMMLVRYPKQVTIF